MMAAKRPNPYSTKGQVTLRGRGSDRDHYSYRGKDFDVARAGPPPAGHSRWPHWVWTAAGKEAGVRGAPTRDAAIERLRLWIDRSIYYEGLPEPEADAFFTMEGEIMVILEESASAHATTRAHVARRLTEEEDKARQQWAAIDCEEILASPDSYREEAVAACEEMEMRKVGFDHFHNLPIGDRLRWIDSLVKDHRLALGLSPAGPPARNPRKKKATKRDRRKLLSKLLRGT